MSESRSRVSIFTDGGCHGNPGPGAWAAVLRCGEHLRELSGSALATTNNRMELQAAIGAIRVLNRPCEIVIHTDSQYLRKGITQWIHNWKRNHWKTAARQPVKNADLWQELDAVTRKHSVEWRWLKGHAGHAENERCDQLATEEIHRIRKAHTSDELSRALADFVLSQSDASPAQSPSSRSLSLNL